MIGVIAARGGFGVTSVASNLAAALAKKIGPEVVLAEFRPGQGTLCYDLRIESAYGQNNVLSMAASEISRKVVQEVIVEHASGVRILAASGQPRDAIMLNRIEQFEVILSRLKFMARIVVVDLGSGLGALNQKLAAAFDELIVVVEPFEISLEHSRALLDDLVELGVDKTHLFIAANYRIRSDTQLSVPQVQEKIKQAVDVTFTPAPELLMQAARRQTMACLVTLESVTTQQYDLLASKIEARAPKTAKK